jgi:hypothetical protein
MEAMRRRAAWGRIAIAIAVTATIAATVGYDLGTKHGANDVWAMAPEREWRVRAGGACDGAYQTAIFLADSLVPGREPFSESQMDRWRAYADKLGEAPEAGSRDVYQALPRGAVVGWTAGHLRPVDLGESTLPTTIREARIPVWMNSGR